MGIILANGQSKKSIRVDTSLGNPIDNYQVFELSEFEKNQFADYALDKYPFAKYRGGPSPEYNCHGMSFAGRRTNIDNAAVIRKILEDDRYNIIDLKSTMPGNLILYIENENNDIAHSGTVVQCEHPENNISTIFVVSKWGKFKEVIHQYKDCPYRNCKTEFYRLLHKQYGN